LSAVLLDVIDVFIKRKMKMFTSYSEIVNKALIGYIKEIIEELETAETWAKLQKVKAFMEKLKKYRKN